MVTINIDVGGEIGSGKTRAIDTMVRALSKQFEIVSKEYLNESAHQVRVKAKLKDR